MAIALTKYDDAGNIVQAGFIPDYPWQDSVCWPVMTGAHWIDTATNTITFNSDAMKEAYQWQADIYSAIGYDKLIAFKDGLGTRDTAEDPLITGKVAMIDEFVDCIEQHQTPKIDLRWHRDTIKAMLACYDSIAGGQPVRL